MALTFADLQTFFLARGFDFLNQDTAGQTRMKRFLNDAMHAIDDAEPWVYLQASQTGTAPVTISDLGRVESVVDTGNLITLDYMQRDVATDYFSDLTLTGTFSKWYYVTGGTVVNTFPVNTGISLTVRYTKVSPDMSAGTDVPLMPDRFRMAIVDYAAMLAFRESNDTEDAQVAQAAGDQVVERMREWDFFLQGGGGQMVVTRSSGDW